MIRIALHLTSCMVAFVLQITAAHGEEGALRLNHIQVLGSHNSYKQAIAPGLFELLADRDAQLALSLQYHHPSLRTQLDAGLRKLELDVFHDPEGGLLADPAGRQLVEEAGGNPGASHDPGGLLRKPGFKVLHVQDIDYRSNCLTLAECLSELRHWSDAHPAHLPVVVSFNAKDSAIDGERYVRPRKFDAAAFAALDQALVEAFGRKRLIVPDDVRGTFDTLEQAVLARGWPTLNAARGRFLFVLDQSGEKLTTYISEYPGLRGRVMFANAPAGTPEAAFLVLNDPLGNADEIRRRVAQGYLVRTRADANTVEARSNDHARSRAAFRSGAHFVSTDYYLPGQAPEGGSYRVQLPGGGAARCNPVVAPSGCTLDAEATKP